MTLLSGWGGTAASVAAEVLAPSELDELAKAPLSPAVGARGLVARGLGRSYGDSAQNAGGVVVDTTAVDHPWHVPAPGDDGVVRLPAGLSIDALLREVVPAGWFVPVSPGTRFVTIGGAIASDVHGKNHHRAGTFGQHVRSLRLALPSGDVVRVGPSADDDPELFWATTGGMGLTGVIVDADVALTPISSAHLVVDTDRADDLDAVMALMSDGDDAYTYSVAWIDLVTTGRSMGRSVLGRGEFAPAPVGDYVAADRLRVPPLPMSAVNKLSVRAFNELWFRKAPRSRRGELQTIPQFFHPLDMLRQWNRAYGPRGFLQWQPVVPLGREDVLAQVVERIAQSGLASFLNVLKRFGDANAAPLSFPLRGWTLSVDFRAAGGLSLAALLDSLDRLVVEAGGRVYLAKDSRMHPSLLPAMYPRLDEWRAVRERVDPGHVLQSDQARRLGL